MIVKESSSFTSPSESSNPPSDVGLILSCATGESPIFTDDRSILRLLPGVSVNTTSFPVLSFPFTVIVKIRFPSASTVCVFLVSMVGTLNLITVSSAVPGNLIDTLLSSCMESLSTVK